MNRDLKQEIKNRAEGLVEKIREYSQSQVDLWQQVPLLALEADVRDTSDHVSDYARWYSYGYLPLHGSHVRDDYTVAVDLATGELVNPAPALYASAVGTKPELARDGYVLRLIHELEELDAQKLIDNLKEQAQKPIDADDEQRKEKTKQELGLTERYQRRK